MDEKDSDIVEKFQNVGIMRCNGETAGLTPLGQDILYLERMERSPIKKFLYSFLNI